MVISINCTTSTAPQTAALWNAEFVLLGEGAMGAGSVELREVFN